MNAADKAAAEAALLKLSDFPSGWTSNPSNSTNAPSDIGQQLADCLHTSQAVLNSGSNNSAESPDFEDSNGNTASNSARYRTSTAEASAEFAVLESQNLPSCLATTVTKVVQYNLEHPSSPNSTVPSGLTVGDAKVAQMSFPPYGDQSIAYRITIPISYKGLNPSVYLDIVGVRRGRATTGLYFEGVGSPFDSTMEQQLTALTVSRLTNT